MTNVTTPSPRPIEEIWQERCAIFEAYAADDKTFSNHALDTSYWDRIDQTEVAILAHPDTSLRAAEIRLWVAFWHCDDSSKNAVARGDVETLRHLDGLDWHEKLILAAILNLRGENL